MVAKRKAKPTLNGITFDSPEEIEFYHWCQEAVEYDLIERFGYQSTTFELAEPVRITTPRFGKNDKPITPKTTTLLRGCTYTADFTLHLKSGEALHVDVKPAYERSQSRAAKFAVLQKWVYDRYSVLVRPVVPIELFQKTWLPAACAVTSTGKRKTAQAYTGLMTVQQWSGFPDDRSAAILEALGGT